MKKFNSIEGLRGWLAWTVVLSHIALASNLYAKGLGTALANSGSVSVLVFVIISGFVITHLLIEKRETYSVYIFRRFMRIFPLFAATCVIGYFSSPLLVDASMRLPWGDSSWFSGLSAALHSQKEFFWPNFFAHLTLMHGAISDSVLPGSSIVFNSPAWSLSLEWQFYLIAPLAVIAVRRVSVAVGTMVILTALCVAYDFNVFGHYELRSVLFASAPLFAVGIASRVAYPSLAKSIRNPTILLILLISLIPVGWDSAPFLIWGCVYVTLLTDRDRLAPIDETAMKIASLMLESRVATFFGRRSYSIYLCHMPVISLVLYVLTILLSNPSKVDIFLALLIPVGTMTFAFACVLYLAVERPGISFGARILKTNRKAQALITQTSFMRKCRRAVDTSER